MLPGDLVRSFPSLRRWGLRPKRGKVPQAGYYAADDIQDARTPPGSPAQRKITNGLRRLRRMVPEACLAGGWDMLPSDLTFCSLVEFADYLEEASLPEASRYARSLAGDVLGLVCSQLGLPQTGGKDNGDL